nr:MAG TPA: hypothetical protein [Caudoviricetes sp.]
MLKFKKKNVVRDFIFFEKKTKLKHLKKAIK